MMLCVNISDIAIIIVNDVDCRCIICDISKSGAINLLESPTLEDRGYRQKCYINIKNQY